MSTCAPKVTVTLGSSRPGGIDIALAGLANQLFDNFEVVFVDGLYHTRHAEVLAAVKRSGLKQTFIHVPNHRYRDDEFGTTSAGYNTGFALAAGAIVVMLLDYAYAPPEWLAAHVAYSTKKLVLGPVYSRALVGVQTTDNKLPLDFSNRQHIEGLSAEEGLANILAQRERYDSISIFAMPFTPDQLDRFPLEPIQEGKCRMPTGSLSAAKYFYTKNESFPLESVLAINGMDENCDRACIPGDLELGARLCRALGVPGWNVQEAIVHCLNPRPIMPRPVNVIPQDKELPPPYENYWPIYNKGWEYFQRVMTNPAIVRADNPFDIHEKREEIWHWRELGQDPDYLIPKNIVPDSDYYSEPLTMPSLPRIITVPQQPQPEKKSVKKDPWFRNRLIRDGIYRATHDAMRRDPTIYLMGEGSHMKIHFDAPEIEREFPGRIITLPISEDANSNFAVGLALAGLTPIVDVISSDFLYRTMDAICNTMAKQTVVGKPRTMIVRAEFMTGGPTSGQRIEALFTHIPGLRVAIPSNPRDAYGLMCDALETKAVTVFFEDRMIEDATMPEKYREIDPTLDWHGAKGARVVQHGAGPVVISYGLACRRVEEALGGSDCTIIDLRTLYPLDMFTIMNKIDDDRTVLIVEPTAPFMGIGAEITAQLAEWSGITTGKRLKLHRLGGLRATIPASRELHDMMVPTVEAIRRTVGDLL